MRSALASAVPEQTEQPRATTAGSIHGAVPHKVNPKERDNRDTSHQSDRWEARSTAQLNCSDPPCGFGGFRRRLTFFETSSSSRSPVGRRQSTLRLAIANRLVRPRGPLWTHGLWTQWRQESALQTRCEPTARYRNRAPSFDHGGPRREPGSSRRWPIELAAAPSPDLSQILSHPRRCSELPY